MVLELAQQKGDRFNMMEWKNSPDLFNDYMHIDECPWGMKQILLQHGWFFDDDYFYWLPRCRKNTKYVDIVKRRPLYWYPQKKTPSEKVKRYIKGRQVRLLEKASKETQQ